MHLLFPLNILVTTKIYFVYFVYFQKKFLGMCFYIMNRFLVTTVFFFLLFWQFVHISCVLRLRMIEKVYVTIEEKRN